MFNIKVINSKEKVYFATGFDIAQIISEDTVFNEGRFRGSEKSHMQQKTPVQNNGELGNESSRKSDRTMSKGDQDDDIREFYAFQGWPVAFTGGICHRYLPVNTGVDNTPKSGVYRHLLAFINISLISLQITLLIVLATYYIIHGHHSSIFAAYA